MPRILGAFAFTLGMMLEEGTVHRPDGRRSVGVSPVLTAHQWSVWRPSLHCIGALPLMLTMCHWSRPLVTGTRWPICPFHSSLGGRRLCSFHSCYCNASSISPICFRSVASAGHSVQHRLQHATKRLVPMTLAPRVHGERTGCQCSPKRPAVLLRHCQRHSTSMSARLQARLWNRDETVPLCLMVVAARQCASKD